MYGMYDKRILTRIINTCTVRDKSIFSFERYYKEAERLHIPVIISGCMTEGFHFHNCSLVADKDIAKRYQQNTIVSVNAIHRIKDIVDSTLQQIPISSVINTEIPPLQLPKIRRDRDVEIIPISLGCNGACTFCQTRLARGQLRSYPIDAIIDRVHEVLSLLLFNSSVN